MDSSEVCRRRIRRRTSGDARMNAPSSSRSPISDIYQVPHENADPVDRQEESGNQNAAISKASGDDNTEDDEPYFDTALSPTSGLLPTSIVERFLEQFPPKLTRTDRYRFREIMIPILRRRLPEANPALLRSIINYFEGGGGFFEHILTDCPVSDWVSRLLMEDLTYRYANQATYAYYEQRLSKIINEYRGSTVKFLLFIRDKQESELLSIVESSDLLEYLLSQTQNDSLADILSNEDDCMPWLQCKYLDHLLARQQIVLLSHDKLFLKDAISRSKWRPCIISEIVCLVKQLEDFTHIKSFLNFIEKHEFSSPEIEQALRQRTDDEGTSFLNACIGKLALTVVKDKINELFTQQAVSINKNVHDLFTFDRPTELLNIFRELLDELPKVDAESQKDSRSKEFCNVTDILVQHNLDVTAIIQAFKLLRREKENPQIWEEVVHKLMIDATFKGTKLYSLAELTDKISQKSPGVTFVSDSNKLQQKYQEIIDGYNGTLAILPAKQISQWINDDVLKWSKRVKETSPQSVRQTEILAVVKRAVEISHGHSPRYNQLLTVLILLNPAENLGRLAQVDTGQGKSLIIAMLSAVYALQGRTVDVISTSVELTIPEVEEQAGFFAVLNLTVGENSSMCTDTVKDVYKRDIVYGIPLDFQGDILRTEFLGQDIRGERKIDVAIGDEIDAMLFDECTQSTRLQSPVPGTDHLILILGAVWQQVNLISNQIITLKGKHFLITEPFTRGGTKENPTITLAEDKDLATCMEPIEDVKDCVTELTKSRIENALRVLTQEEKKELLEYKILEKKTSEIYRKLNTIARKISRRKLQISSGSLKWFGGNVKKHKEKLTKYEEEQVAVSEEAKSVEQSLNSAPFSRREPTLDLPTHLREFALSQLPEWINNAILASNEYKKNRNYTVEGGKIIPIDYNSTGVLQHRTVWSDGLHQLLQIKEGLKVSPENIVTNFISYVTFFKQYGSSLFGLTGTLGNAPTCKFLREMYNVDMVVIPSFKDQIITNNENTHYRCKELAAIIVPTTEEWYEKILDTVASKVRNGRPVLIICKYIEDVTCLKYELAQRLGKNYENRIFIYTGESENKKNIAKAETTTPIDFKFINLTATGKGDVIKRTIDVSQIIIATSIAGRGTDISTSRAVEAVGGIHVCNTFFPNSSRVGSQNSGRAGRQGNKGSVQLVLHEPSGKSIKQLRTERDMKESIFTANAKKDAEKAIAKDKLFSCYCAFERELFPRDTKVQNVWIKSERINRPRKYSDPNSSSLMQKFNWGKEERNALQERFGFRFKYIMYKNKSIDEHEVLTAFEQFADIIQTDAKENKLIKNPYYYVQKGNAALDISKNPQLAIEIYNKAIDLDPSYSVSARYNKAKALLTIKENKGHNQRVAKKELEEAIRIIDYSYKPDLIVFHNFVGSNRIVDCTDVSEHIRHHLDILSMQSDYIELAIEVIDKALKKDWNVKLTSKVLKDALKDADGDHSQAINEVNTNGLTSIFTLSPKKPIPWGSIVAVAVIGVSQIAFGAVVNVFTGLPWATTLIWDGIHDLINCVTSAIKGDFDWKKWAIHKGLSLCTRFLISGWNGIKTVYTGVKNTCRGIKDSIVGVNQAAAVGAEITGAVTFGQSKIFAEGLEVARNQLSTLCKKGAANCLLNVATDYCLIRPALRGIGSTFDSIANKAISEGIRNINLVSRGVALDLRNKSNYWQQLFIKQGLDLLQQPYSEYISGVKDVGYAIANKMEMENEHTADTQSYVNYLDLLGIGKLSYDVLWVITRFFSNFESKIDVYDVEISRAEDRQEPTHDCQTGPGTSSSETRVSAAPSENEFVGDGKDSFCPDYNSEKRNAVEPGRNHTCYMPSDEKHIEEAFKSVIINQLVTSVESHVMAPFRQRYAASLTKNMWKESAEAVKKATGTFRPQVEIYNVGEEITRSNEHKVSVDLSELNPDEQTYFRKILDGGSPLGVDILPHVSKVANAPIEVYVNGEYLYTMGKTLPGPKVLISNFCDTEHGGHWINMRDTTLIPAKDSSNLFDAVLPQIDRDVLDKQGIRSPNDFRAHCVKSSLSDLESTRYILEKRSLLAELNAAFLYEAGKY